MRNKLSPLLLNHACGRSRVGSHPNINNREDGDRDKILWGDRSFCQDGLVFPHSGVLHGNRLSEGIEVPLVPCPIRDDSGYPGGT
ncbi:hypothetical protein RRG08_047877 [Elysia crispata]|uniref:Uncharacterized protein n=1 Tax=Elysia crispata TaxID=231223 RepID=A0AAE0ZLL9_9GAST|nr:hypothetical protein RRG08_047877 [Elysia crispata]